MGVPQRYPSSWNAWQSSRGTYAASYVRPERWSLTLNGCRSSGAGEKIVSYEWTIPRSHCRRIQSSS